VALAVAGVAALAVLGAVYEAEKPGVPPERRERILDCVPLRDHQLKRVTTFLFPERDQMGAGYNLRQSLIAIGSGGVTGKGLGKGESSHLRYLPPSVSMNDFIFCVWAEETGYAGALALLALFGVLCLSCVWTAFVCADGTGRVLALGVSTLLFAHVYVNIAMTVGLLPVTGLPLPFISSGRTFLVVVIAGLGLVQSVSIHREEEEQ
jgi:rod shape determining protein RodA